MSDQCATDHGAGDEEEDVEDDDEENVEDHEEEEDEDVDENSDIIFFKNMKMLEQLKASLSYRCATDHGEDEDGEDRGDDDNGDEEKYDMQYVPW